MGHRPRRVLNQPQTNHLVFPVGGMPRRPSELRERARSVVPTLPKDTRAFTTSLKVEKVIGDGSFGRVYLVKVLRTTEGQTSQTDLFEGDQGPVIRLDSTEFKEVQESEPGSPFALKVMLFSPSISVSI